MEVGWDGLGFGVCRCLKECFRKVILLWKSEGCVSMVFVKEGRSHVLIHRILLQVSSVYSRLGTRHASLDSFVIVGMAKDSPLVLKRFHRALRPISSYVLEPRIIMQLCCNSCHRLGLSFKSSARRLVVVLGRRAWVVSLGQLQQKCPVTRLFMYKPAIETTQPCRAVKSRKERKKSPPLLLPPHPRPLPHLPQPQNLPSALPKIPPSSHPSNPPLTKPLHSPSSILKNSESLLLSHMIIWLLSVPS